MLTLPISLTISATAAILNIWLALRVGRLRVSEKVAHGDGGHLQLTQRMRAHANYTEYTPFVLILIALIELSRGTSDWLWAIGVVYIVGRICHLFGMDAEKPGPLRMIGIIVTFLTLLALAGIAIYTVYAGPPEIVTNIALGN